MIDDPEPLTLLGRQCPKQLRLRTVILQPQDAIDFLAADWAATIVIVEQGVLEIECCSGTCASFAEGAVVSFDGLTLRRVKSVGATTLVLTALSRRR